VHTQVHSGTKYCAVVCNEAGNQVHEVEEVWMQAANEQDLIFRFGPEYKSTRAYMALLKKARAGSLGVFHSPQSD
jgi:hypothetical protein